MAITAIKKGSQSLFDSYKNKTEESKDNEDKPVMESETVNLMKDVLLGKITGAKATEVKQMFDDEFGSEALSILKKELKIK